MEDGHYYQAPVDKAIPSSSNLQINPAALMQFKDAGLNGGSDGFQNPHRIDKFLFAPEKTYPVHFNRLKPNPPVAPQPKRVEKKRPMTYMERLKSLKKSANTKKNKLNKTEFSTFKSNLERRKAIQNNLRLNRAALANGNHLDLKNNFNDSAKIQPLKVPQYNSPKSAFVNKGKECGTPLEDYQYGLQSSVTFKCRKCGCTSFESLEMLKVHQLHCSSQASTSDAQEADSSSTNGASGSVNSRTTRQVVLCSACGTYFENWDLFLHMREVHGRHICLFCLGLFSQPDKLASHLSSKHNVQENYFQCNNDLLSKYTETFYLICCKCESMFTSKDNYVIHECKEVVRYCSVCNLKGSHKPDCPKNSKKSSQSRDLNKQNKNNLPSKPVYDPLLNIHPGNEYGLLDKAPFSDGVLGGFDYRNGKELTDLSALEGLGINEFGAALSYAIPETKPEKISAESLAQLIEEVKNCVSAAPAPIDSQNSAESFDIKPPIASQDNMESHSKMDPIKTECSDDGSIKVPKLTVKLPKVKSDKDSSEYSSESEDSDKLTVDLGANADGQGHFYNKVEKDAVTNPTPEEIVPAGDDIPIIELTLEQPLDKYLLRDLLQVLLNSAVFSCIYCNHARKIAVNGKQLGLHFISQHKFSATVNSITAEELLPETIITKIKACLDEVQDVYINLNDFNKPQSDIKLFEQNYECFQCYYVTLMHKELYFHNRKMHQKTILLCIMCKSNFYTYSELICHLCPGTYVLNKEILFRCCVCDFDNIPSAFRLMVHLRKRHLACDVCLESCSNQSKLSNHVWKHKLHHLCYRCGIAYRNKPDITNHLFWKHGTESVLCKKCLQKKWPHVYHFCTPPPSFACDECSLTFSKAVYLRVHKRSHSGEFPYECKEANCGGKFISKKLLEKHVCKHTTPVYDVEVIDPADPPVICISDDPANNTVDLTSPTNTSKKKKKNKKDSKDLLLDVNLPELNLSESGSSDDSESETPAVQPAVDKPMDSQDESQPRVDSVEEVKQAEPVAGVWDNFKLYQKSLEDQIEKPHVPKHVCESDHDYFIIPTSDSPDVEIIGETKLKPELPKESPKKKKMTKKKSKTDMASSSSDSSSDSDSTCSGGSNCSCCSSSGSSSSSSSSDSSTSASRKRLNKPRKDSDASAVDVMATEEPPILLPEKTELQIAESDLYSEESATDEEFYDKHPQKLANKLINEKRNLSTQSVNGGFVESSRPPTPEDTERKKKPKLKKKKKERKSEASVSEQIKSIAEIPNIPVEPPKITIPLPIKIPEVHSVEPKINSGVLSDDSKRASKRRRVPNKFYGYSSDEEFVMKPQPPPKLEWRKEDLPSPSGLHIEPIMEPPRIPEIPIQPEPIPIKIHKETSSEDSDSDKEGALQIKDSYSPDQEIEPVKQADNSHNVLGLGIPFPRPAGAREAREGESVYCYCRCPYDEVSEMIACDADGCAIEWFHFECVGIMVPPKGKWYCPDCRIRVENAYK